MDDDEKARLLRMISGLLCTVASLRVELIEMRLAAKRENG